MSGNCRLNGLVTRLVFIDLYRSGTDSRSCRSQEETMILGVAVKEGRSPRRGGRTVLLAAQMVVAKSQRREPQRCGRGKVLERKEHAYFRAH